MESTRLMDIEALSATMIRCPGMNMSPAVRLKLTRPPTKEERLRTITTLLELGTEGPLFTPMWHQAEMYLHPAEGDTITVATSDCFAVIERLNLDPYRHIIDIPFEDSYKACPAHHGQGDDLIEMPLPEVSRTH